MDNPSNATRRAEEQAEALSPILPNNPASRQYSAQQAGFHQLNLLAPNQETMPISPCASCGSTRLNVVQMPSHCHFAALRCGNCDRFLRWQPQPKNIEARQRRQTTISHLLKSPQLSEWERAFLEGLKGKKISPRQQEVLEKIKTRVGGAR